MATHDHTVRIRPSVPPDGTVTPPSGDASHTRVAWPESPPTCTRSDIALAVLALARLRQDGEQCRQARVRGCPGGPLEWPFPAVVTASLGTAIQRLQQCANLLGHEPQVKPPRIR